MSVNEKMTAIADAIRGKTGGTTALTLDQMAAEIAGIETGGGGDSYNNPWVSYETVEIEIGENAVTTTQEACAYMVSASGLTTIDSFLLLDNITANLQMVYKLDASNGCARYRNGRISGASWNHAQFDAALIPGTKYLVRKMTEDGENTTPY